MVRKVGREIMDLILNLRVDTSVTFFFYKALNLLVGGLIDPSPLRCHIYYSSKKKLKSSVLSSIMIKVFLKILPQQNSSAYSILKYLKTNIHIYIYIYGV